MTLSIALSPGSVTLDSLRRIHDGGPCQLTLGDESWAGIAASRRVLDDIAHSGRTVYGVNTGFGKLAQTRIPDEHLALLQRNLVLSHCTDVGPRLAEPVVRLVLALKVIGLARGFSGVRREIVEALVKLLAAGVYPCIPSKGSVGASGDLAPLAHVAAVLIGTGEVTIEGKVHSATEGLARAGLAPIELGPKEGLALLNGTQVSTALTLAALFDTERVFCAALIAGALSTEAIKGSDTPFDARIHAARGHAAQSDVAQVLRQLLAGSEIRQSHLDCTRVQDPYSIRCQPQVMGACLEAMRHAGATLVIEANAASDNPLVFADEGDVLSGGNFHAEPVAFAADHLALAIAEIGALSERRIALLVDADLSGLPPFLVNEGGLNSGFMIAHVSAAALASENKSLAHPSSVDSLPTSANQEDHVSMAAHAGRRLHEMIFNTAHIVAIEALAAAQGMEFHRPHRSSAALEAAFAAIRARVPRYDTDRYFAPDIEQAAAWVRTLTLDGNMRCILPSARM